MLSASLSWCEGKRRWRPGGILKLQIRYNSTPKLSPDRPQRREGHVITISKD